MQIFISLVFLIFSSLMLFSPAFAKDEDDWGSIMTDVNSNDIDFGKIITDTEYKNAVKTKENYIKKNKKKLKKNSEEKQEEKVMLDVPESPAPLLTLPVDVLYENSVINKGFYLVNLKTEEGKYFLELRQGKSLPVAVIEAQGFTAPGKTILKPQVSVENVDDKMIKINYSEDNLILESILMMKINYGGDNMILESVLRKN